MTLRRCRGIWWRRSWFSLNGTIGIQERKGTLSYATQFLRTSQPTPHRADRRGHTHQIDGAFARSMAGPPPSLRHGRKARQSLPKMYFADSRTLLLALLARLNCGADNHELVQHVEPEWSAKHDSKGSNEPADRRHAADLSRFGAGGPIIDRRQSQKAAVSRIRIPRSASPERGVGRHQSHSGAGRQQPWRPPERAIATVNQTHARQGTRPMSSAKLRLGITPRRKAPRRRHTAEGNGT